MSREGGPTHSVSEWQLSHGFNDQYHTVQWVINCKLMAGSVTLHNRLTMSNLIFEACGPFPLHHWISCSLSEWMQYLTYISQGAVPPIILDHSVHWVRCWLQWFFRCAGGALNGQATWSRSKLWTTFPRVGGRMRQKEWVKDDPIYLSFIFSHPHPPVVHSRLCLKPGKSLFKFISGEFCNWVVIKALHSAWP